MKFILAGVVFGWVMAILARVYGERMTIFQQITLTLLFTMMLQGGV